MIPQFRMRRNPQPSAWFFSHSISTGLRHCWHLLAMLFVFAISFQSQAIDSSILTPPLFQVEANHKLPGKEVLKLEIDQQGFIWVGTRRGVFRFDGYEYQPLESANKLDLSKLHVRALLADGQILWIGTMTQGVYRVDLSTWQATHFARNPGMSGSIGGSQVNAIKKDRNGKLWFAHDRGLDSWSEQSAQFTPYLSLDKPDDRYHNYLLDIEFDAEGKLWLSTAMGLASMDMGAAGFRLFANEGEMLHRVVLRRLYLASDNRLWLTSQNQGSYILSPDSGRVLQLEQDESSAAHKVINTGIAETLEADGSRRIWLSGTKGVELRDGKTGKLIKHLQGNLLDHHGLAGDVVYSITSSPSGTLWLGVLGVGLQFHPPQAQGFSLIDRFAPALKELFSSNIHQVLNLGADELLVLTEQQASRVNLSTGLIAPFSDDVKVQQKLLVAAIKDHQDNFWFGGDSGNLITTSADGHWRNELQLPLTKNDGVFVKSLALGQEQELWAGTDRGLVRVSLDNLSMSPLKNADGSRFISFVRCLYLDEQNRLWVGTQGGLGLVMPGADTVNLFSREQATEGSLRHNQINQILGDSQGNLLITHPEGIDRLSSSELEKLTVTPEPMSSSGSDKNVAVLRFSPFANDITAQMIQPARLVALPTGQLWLGNTHLLDENGLLLAQFGEREGALDLGWSRSSPLLDDHSFAYASNNSMQLISTKARPQSIPDATVAITHIQLGSVDMPFDPLSPGLVVGADDQRFSVRFASPDASSLGKVDYRYRLDGYDNDWLAAPEDMRLARYTALPPGEYRLHLQARAQGGDWGPELLLNVSKVPNYYQTLWFQLLMATLLLALLYGLFRWRLARARAQQLAQFEHRDALRKAEMLSELMEQKNRMLAEVGHDLRTPLAMIKVQLEAMQDGLLQSSDATFESMANSLGNLNRMVGDIVQLSAEEGTNLAMSKAHLKLLPLIEEQITGFRPLMAQKGIRVSFSNNCQPELLPEPAVFADKARLEQVLGNLLKNSYKYTNHGGQVQLLLAMSPSHLPQEPQILGASQQAWVTLRIDDSAPGVAAEEYERLFDRLYRASNTGDADKAETASGSGLGLWICQSIIRAHGGTITASPSPLGGVAIEIQLPLSIPISAKQPSLPATGSITDASQHSA
ncbi:two-component regulator propeller domain-containing protein [Shewanella amazonensis]|nr:two-component regulator propeller domain-containing protein [Shewanella amazonensis]